MGERAKITLARFASGVVIRVEGAGTLGESAVLNAFAEDVLRDRGQRVIVDMTACSYMDSTFLGGLVGLFKRHGAGGGNRFAIVAPLPRRRSLFGLSRLDKILPFVDEVPASAERGIPLEAQAATSREDLARYIVECHRRLAEIGGPEAQDFAAVADAIAAEVDIEQRRR